MRVLLLNAPPFKIQEAYYDTPPYPRTALAMLAAHLRREEIDVHVIDCKYDRLDYDAAMQRVREIKPDVVGLTAFTNEIIQAAKLATMIRAEFPQVATIVGGVHASIMPEATLREFTVFDYVIAGEGELTLTELLRTIEAEPSDKAAQKQKAAHVEGVGTLLGSEYAFGGARPKIDDLDVLAEPAWDLFRPAKEYILHSSRGCPFHCPFCVNPNGRKVRPESAGRVLSELEHLVKTYGDVRVFFGDEIFTVKRERTVELLKGMIDRGLNKRIRWGCMTHVKFIDDELAKLMKDAGCDCVGLGIESGDEERLKKINKGTNLEDIYKAVESMRKVKLTYEAFFILGQPDETEQSACETIDFAVKINPTRPVFGIMVPYPGTEVGRLAAAGDGGYTLQARDWNDYNKQLGDALTFTHVPRKTLERLQFIGYIKVFLYNWRILDFIRFCWNYRSVGFSVLRKVVRSHLGLAPRAAGCGGCGCAEAKES